MKSILSTLTVIWRLSAPYFRSHDRWPGRILLFSVIAIELALVGIDVILNYWNNRFFQALQDRNESAYLHELLFFTVVVAIFILLAVYQLYLNQWLQIRWRRWMTEVYLDRWLQHSNHYRMQLRGDAADNPDQRIAEDIRLFIESTLTIGLGFLNAVVTLASFILILWTLSAAAPLVVFGQKIDIPGYLVWGALVYAIGGTLITHWIGWPLSKLNFDQQRYEADFRFNLVRVRENSEQIALLSGENAESGRLLTRFADVVNNWHRIMIQTKKLTFFTAGYRQAAVIFPYILVSPAYFSNVLQLGGVAQTASAFSSVQTSLSFFITTYRQLAEWTAVIARLEGFLDAIEASERAAATSQIARKTTPEENIAVSGLALQLPTGAPLVAADSLTIRPGERALVMGPSGSGKSTLFRAIAGLWPFGRGRVTIPAGAKVMMLPQRPYFPIASLAGAINYPAPSEAFDETTISEALTAVGLPNLASRLREEAHWNRMLSLGEQQRLGIVRALLHKPDFLFLDEATASLDEPSEAAIYKLLNERLPNTTIVSIGHRSSLTAFHQRGFRLAPDDGAYRVQEAQFEQR